MKQIYNYIKEGLKIGSKTKVNTNRDEEFYEKSSELWTEVQNEIETNAAYRSYVFSDGMKKYKKGFLTFSEDGEFISISAFNKLQDFIDMINGDKENYEEYDEIEVGETGEVYDNRNSITKIMRIW